jgi:hypothetical protein
MVLFLFHGSPHIFICKPFLAKPAIKLCELESAGMGFGIEDTSPAGNRHRGNENKNESQKIILIYALDSISWLHATTKYSVA